MQFDSDDPLEFSRLTIFLDTFDKNIITQIAGRRNQSHSEAISYVIHNWIESFPDILKGNYNIDLGEISRDLDLINPPEVNKNSFQKVKKNHNSNRVPKLFRITFNLSSFDNKIITGISKIKGKTRSEIVQNLIHSWIERNSGILRSKFKIDVIGVRKDIEYNQIIQDIIPKLVLISDSFISIEINLLAENLGINPKILSGIILKHNQKLFEKGLNLKLKGNLIVNNSYSDKS